MIDSGKVVGYLEIAKEIVEKCALILNSEFRKGLTEAGINTKLHELTNIIKSSNPVATLPNSKWKTVKGALATLQKLGSLIAISKPKTEKNDVVEISKIWNIILVILESSLSATEILKLLEKRRIRALCRALGFRFLKKFVTITIN